MPKPTEDWRTWWIGQDRIDAAVPAVCEAIELDLDPDALEASAATLPTPASTRWARKIAEALRKDGASVAPHLKEVWEVRDPFFSDQPIKAAADLHDAVRDLLVGCADVLGRDPLQLLRELMAEAAA